jgi:ribonucleoside-diphosphate reductase alpha chain
MELTKNALTVLRARYLRKNERGKIIETPEEMLRRVASTVASAEHEYGEDPDYWGEQFFSLMSELKFLPNSPTLMNAGKESGQLAACFVLPVDDSMRSIFDTLKNAALILQSGGGTGFSFSHLRPKSDIVRSTGGIASGPVSFMKIYNTATDVIKQGGARRGANMGILRVDHPDILDFIRLKRNKGELLNFNISVAVTDAFIKAVRTNRNYMTINPRSGKRAGRLKARLVFDEMVKSAWENGDPGVVFIDRVNRDNPTPQLGGLESTNPCGEQPLLPYEACVLGSINLSKYVTGGKVDYTTLKDTVRTGVRFLDNCIDMNKYPLPEIERMHKGNRKIGLGVMGWADMLILLGIPYNSQKALELAEEIMRFIHRIAREMSVELAEKRGNFANFDGSVHDRPNTPSMRNATLTTIAPTGTLSIIADCSSGIEPHFSLAYTRHVLDKQLKEINKYFFRTAKERKFYSKELREQVISKGSLKGIKGIPKDVRSSYITALEITPEDHIRMQAAFQLYTDNAVSKTVNMSKRAKTKDVEEAFLMSYDMGCKGITVFRQGAKKTGTLQRISETD